MKEKFCSGCDRTLEIDAFEPRDRTKPDGAVYSKCRECRRTAAAERKKRRTAAARAIASTPGLGTFPEDFLLWRESVCAYKRERDGLVVRAVTNWYQRKAVEELRKHKRLVMVMAPGHLKSSLAVEYLTHRIMADRDFRGLLVQKNQAEARKQLGAVARRLSDDEYYEGLIKRLKLQGDIPIINPLRAWFARKPFKPPNRSVGSVWSADAIQALGQSSGAKDYSLQALGVGGQILGIRAQVAVLDDVQDGHLARTSPQDSADKLSWFRDTILGRIDPEHGQVIVLANKFAPDDFASLLVSEVPGFAVVSFPALIPQWLANGEPEPEDDTDSPLVPLCPEYWSVETLAAREKEVGAEVWHYQYMQDSTSFHSTTFRREALEAAKDERLKLGEIPHDVSDIFLGVDPAISASGTCSIVAWGLSRKTKQRYLLDIYAEQGLRSWQNIVDAIIEVGRPFTGRLRSCVVELASTQAGLINDERLRRELASLGAKVSSYRTRTGVGGGEMEGYSISTVGTLFDEGLVTLPYGGTYAEIAKVDALCDELVAWRTDEQGHSIKQLKRDRVMALTFSESAAFVVANRKVEPVLQNVRAPAFAKDAWHRFDRKGLSTIERQSARLAAIREEADAAIDQAIEEAR